MDNTLEKPIAPMRKPLSNTQICGIRRLKHITKKDLPNLRYYEKNVIGFLLGPSIRRKFNAKEITYFLHDEDLISNLMFAFMRADCAHNPQKGASKETLRYLSGLWFLYKYREYWHRHTRNPIWSLDHPNLCHNNGRSSLRKKTITFLPHEPSTLYIVLAKERQQKLKELTELPCLDDRQKAIMREFFIEKKSGKQIGITHNISYQRVYQIIPIIVKKIQKYIDNKPSLKEYWQDEIDARTLQKK